jgi:hypothetical protein
MKKKKFKLIVGILFVASVGCVSQVKQSRSNR